MTRDHNQGKDIDSAAKRNGPGFDSDFRRVSRFEADVSRRLGMTLNQLASFAAVAHYSNLTMASAALRVSQPSISQHLRQLEQSYGVKLYRRLSRGIEITEAGQSFLRDIIPILALVAKLGEGS
jgi:DNA-binding MarR family transcriptional regulator